MEYFSFKNATILGLVFGACSSLLLDPNKECNLVCPCQAKEVLDIEHYSAIMFSENKYSEKELKRILVEINKDNFDDIKVI